MKKNNFFEGFLLGAVAGVLGSFLWLETIDKSSLNTDSSDKPDEKDRDLTETRVQKTLDAIEKGFEKLNSMVNDSKSTPSQKSQKTKNT